MSRYCHEWVVIDNKGMKEGSVHQVVVCSFSYVHRGIHLAKASSVFTGLWAQGQSYFALPESIRGLPRESSVGTLRGCGVPAQMLQPAWVQTLGGTAGG